MASTNRLTLTAAILVACGPSGTEDAPGGGGGTGMDIGSSSESASETGVAGTTGGECSEVFFGDVIWWGDQVREPHDLDQLVDVGRVDGVVNLQSSPLSDVLFFGCLREVEALSIVSNDELVSLAGLERLETTSRLTIRLNATLTTLGAIGSIRTLEQLWVTHNPVLSDLGLGALESAREVYLHRNEMLTEIDLEALQSVDKLYLGLGDCGDPSTGPDGRSGSSANLRLRNIRILRPTFFWARPTHPRPSSIGAFGNDADDPREPCPSSCWSRCCCAVRAFAVLGRVWCSSGRASRGGPDRRSAGSGSG